MITFVRSRLVLGKHSSSRLKFVVHLRHGNQIAMPRKERGKAANWSGHLEDLGIEDDAGELRAFNSWAKEIGSHRTVDRENVLNEIVFEDHGIPLRDSRYADRPKLGIRALLDQMIFDYCYTEFSELLPENQPNALARRTISTNAFLASSDVRTSPG